MKKKLLSTFYLIFLAISSYANLYINEVNPTGKWIEIYNDGENTVDVGGYLVTRNNNDGATNTAVMPVGTIIASKSFLVLYRGSDAPSPIEDAIDCLPFGISSDKFMNAILFDDYGNIIDIFDIGDPQAVTVSVDKSWARENDGAGIIVALNPTPGKSNTSLPTYSTLNIFINEVNSNGKWIEIYNDEEDAIDIGRFTITRYNNDGAVGIAGIPAGNIIASKGFLVIYEGSASGGSSPSPVEGAIDCMPYGISSEKFMCAILKDKQNNIVDNTFDIGDPQTVAVSGGKSWAREADGDNNIVALEPTPGKSNTTIIPRSEFKIYVNEVNSTGKWIEFYNDEEDVVDMGGYTVTRSNYDGTSSVTLPAGITIEPKGFLVIYQGVVSGGSSLSPVEGAIDCLTYGISSDRFMSAVLKDNNGLIVDDSFDINYPQTVTVSGGKSWARESDGAAVIVALEPTPGKSNTTIIPPSELNIYVNEVNSTGKWIEFYNDEELAINISGFTITRNNYDGTSTATIPAGTIIASKGFLVIYQGAESGGSASSPVEGAIDCLTYGISSDRFMNAILKDNNGLIVDDSFDIGYPQTITVNGGKSWARETDGAANIVALEPTPGFPNDGSSNLDKIESTNNIAFVYKGLLNLPEKTSSVKLYNISGNLILNQIVNISTIDLTNFPKGFYIVNFTISGKLYSQKIVL